MCLYYFNFSKHKTIFVHMYILFGECLDVSVYKTGTLIMNVKVFDGMWLVHYFYWLIFI